MSKVSTKSTAKSKSSEYHVHKVIPLSKPTAWSKAFSVMHSSFIPSFLNQEEKRGSENQTDYIRARNHLKEFNSLWPIIISYWSNLKQTHILVFPFMLIWAMLITTVQCWNHQKAKVGIQQASEKARSETLGNSKPSIMDSWINFPAIVHSLPSLFSCSNQCPSVLPETAGHSAKSVLPSPHFWTHSFKVRRKTTMTFGQQLWQSHYLWGIKWGDKKFRALHKSY